MEGPKGDAVSKGRFKPPTPDAPPQPKAQGQARYVAIRPRPPEPPKPLKPPRQSTATGLRPPPLPGLSGHRKCPVPICKRLNCRLQTHQNYGKYRMQAAQRSSPSSKTSRTPSPLLTGDLSGLPELPLGERQPAVYRKLFHDFFGTTYDRIAILLSPPPLSPELKNKAAAHKKAMLHRSLQTPVYCLNYVASAFVAHPRPSQDRDAVVLYGKVMRLLREKLANFLSDEVDNLTVVILTLVMLDIAVNNYSNLEVHRAGMALLVDSRGGLHNLDASLVYTVTLDRMISIYIGKPPLYVPRLDRSLQRPHQFKHVYGFFFESPSVQAAELPTPIIEYCQDVCRAVELFEGQDIGFDPSTVAEAQSPDVHYFYFLRTHLENEFSHLNADYAKTHGKARCILLAAKIVEYLVLMDNYIATTPAFLATKIRECLELQDIEEEWTGLDAALRWVQWTMACVPKFSEDAQQNTLAFLVDRAEAMYQRLPFPLDWNEQGLQFECVRNFVWASSLDERLARVCDEEDVMLRKRLANNVMEPASGSVAQARPDAKGKGKRKVR